MVRHGLAGLFAGQQRLVHHLHEVAPVLVIQQGRERTGRPEFVARFILLANAFKRGVQGGASHHLSSCNPHFQMTNVPNYSKNSGSLVFHSDINTKSASTVVLLPSTNAIEPTCSSA